MRYNYITNNTKVISKINDINTKRNSDGNEETITAQGALFQCVFNKSLVKYFRCTAQFPKKGIKCEYQLLFQTQSD